MSNYSFINDSITKEELAGTEGKLSPKGEAFPKARDESVDISKIKELADDSVKSKPSQPDPYIESLKDSIVLKADSAILIREESRNIVTHCPIPARHYGENHSTITQCAKAHPDVFDSEPDRQTFIKVLPVEPMPAGTPFFIAYLNTSLEPSLVRGKRNHRTHGYYGTHPVESADQFTIYERLRDYEFRRIMPKLGKSVNRKSFPAGAIMTIKGEDGKRVPYRCTEQYAGEQCNGHYITGNNGTIYCSKCGIFYSWQADESNVRKVSFFETLSEDSFEAGDFSRMEEVDEEVLPTEVISEVDGGEATSQDVEQYGGEDAIRFDEVLGNTSTGSAKARESRLERNIREWRLMISEPTRDELKAKQLNKDKVKATRQAKSIMRKVSVYKCRINEVKQDDRKARILSLLKVEGKCSIAKVVELTGMHRTAAVRILTALVKDGRMTVTKQGRESIYEVI